MPHNDPLPAHTRTFLECAKLEAERLESLANPSNNQQPRVLPYLALPDLHVMEAGRHAFVLVTTGDSKCKEEDLNLIEEIVPGVCPTETVAVFIAKPNFSLIEDPTARGECRFKAIGEIPGDFYTFRMVTTRVQVCHHVSGGNENLAGISLYPAFHREYDSLVNHEDVIRQLVGQDAPRPASPQALDVASILRQFAHNSALFYNMFGLLPQRMYPPLPPPTLPPPPVPRVFQDSQNENRTPEWLSYHRNSKKDFAKLEKSKKIGRNLNSALYRPFL